MQSLVGSEAQKFRGSKVQKFRVWGFAEKAG